MPEIDLGLVRGPKGDTGDIGPQGPQGPQGNPTTVNGKTADSNGAITLLPSDIGALPSDGTAVAASKLATARTIALTGDVSGSATFNGTANASIATTLKPSGVTAGTYGASGQLPQLTLDSKGIVTGAKNIQILPSSIGAASNPNLLDNWYFADPINQRGETKYTATGYTIDRWINGRGTVQVNDGYISLTYGGTLIYSYFEQKFDYDISSWLGQTLTASALTYDGRLFAWSFVLDSLTSKKISQAFDDLLGFAFYPAQKALDIDIYPNAVDLRLTAAKLELGSQQTLAHQENGVWVLNDPAPNKALELLKCQRYFVRVNSGRFRMSVNNTGGQMYFAIPVPAALRRKPTYTIVEADNTPWIRTLNNEGVLLPSSVPSYISTIGHNYVMLVIQHIPSDVSDACLFINGYIDFDANL